MLTAILLAFGVAGFSVASVLSWRIVNYKYQLALRQQSHIHKLELLNRAQDVFSILLVDKELGQLVYKQLSDEFQPIQLSAPVIEAEEIVIHYSKLRKTACGRSLDLPNARAVDKVSCKACLRILNL